MFRRNVYNDNFKGVRITCLCRVEDTDLHKKHVIVPVFEFTSLNCGNVYKGSSKWLGVRKSGEFFIIDGKITVVEEEPQFYV